MIYKIKPGQISYGESIGIILLDSEAPYIPGDVANATTYEFPVRFQRVPGLTVEKIMNHDLSLLDEILNAGKVLKAEGVRAITSDCGFMALYQHKLVEELDIPVFLSSLLQIPFIKQLTPKHSKIGIITANKSSLTKEILALCEGDLPERIVIEGLEEKPYFSSAFLKEEGILDTVEVQREVVTAAKKLQNDYPNMKSILLECSVLPPYASAVQKATGLPVFDFVTMIQYMHSIVVRDKKNGYM
jgi:Asp/Glu/hydantoin racemase